MEPTPSRPATGRGMSYEQLKHGLSERNHITSDDDYAFGQWIESISTTQDELKILIAHPNYALYQAMDGHPKNGVLNLLNQFQDRYSDGWKKLIRTVTETVHHSHLRGHH